MDLSIDKNKALRAFCKNPPLWAIEIVDDSECILRLLHRKELGVQIIHSAPIETHFEISGYEDHDRIQKSWSRYFPMDTSFIRNNGFGAVRYSYDAFHSMFWKALGKELKRIIQEEPNLIG